VLVYLQTPRPGLRGGRSSYSATGCSPEVEKIVPLQDNLNTHTPASPYKASEPEKAGRLVEKTGWHYTAKHGCWLNMAECEISVPARAALKQRTGSLEKPGEVWRSLAGEVWRSLEKSGEVWRSCESRYGATKRGPPPGGVAVHSSGFGEEARASIPGNLARSDH